MWLHIDDHIALPLQRMHTCKLGPRLHQPVRQGMGTTTDARPYEGLVRDSVHLHFAAVAVRRRTPGRLIKLQPAPCQAVQCDGGLQGIPRHLHSLQRRLQSSSLSTCDSHDTVQRCNAAGTQSRW
jgi:hypothetical protein